MKWRQYLHGNKCVVYTDHQPLTYIYTQPHMNARQARWLERLAELDLDIVYRPGVDNVAADVLSRFNQHVQQDSEARAQHSLQDAKVVHAVRTWLGVVAPHLDYDLCVSAAVEGLSRGHPLASFPCNKCG